MDQERFEEIDRILEAALKIEPEGRDDFLKRACGDDDDLRREVELLLGKGEEARKMEVPAIAYVAEELAGRADAVFAGQRISRYVIKELIGVGGMGEVWKAEDEPLNRDVAIKILPLEFSADPDRVRRFEQEALTVSALKHPNIITIHEVGRIGSLRFIVTEFIEGRTLREHLRKSGGAGSWRDAVRIAAQIAGALRSAHTAGVIHRDIKPENVMIQADGLVKALDFGIAKRVGVPTVSSDGADQTTAGAETLLGAKAGTLKYMSPEQACGERLDGRTDIFSLGLALYEMITGRHPYNGKSAEEIMAALKSNDEIPPVSIVNDRIPAALDRIVSKALRKNRDERYSSAEEMLGELELLKSLIGVSPGEKQQQEFKARNADQLLTQFAVLYEVDKKTRMSLGGLWSVWRVADLKAGRLEREMMRRSLFSGLARAGFWVLVIAGITMIGAAAMSVSEEYKEKVMRDGHTAVVRCSAFSPDGLRLVTGDEDGWVIVWDFARRERLATFKAHAAWVNSMAFSPDGKWFTTCGDDRNVIVWDAARLEQVTVLHDHQWPVVSVVFSPNGRLLAATSGGQRGRTILWEVGGWRKTHELPIAFGRGRLSFSPDGRRLIVSQRLQTWDLETSREALDYLDPSWGGDETAISAEAGRLVSISTWGAVTFVDLTKRRLLGRRSADHYMGDAIAISPDGRFVASGAGDVLLWDAGTQTKLARLEHMAMVKSLTFSPDGRWLVSTHEDGAVLQWDVAERERIANFNEHSGSVLAVVWAPDGQRFASAGADRSVIIWNATTGRKEATLIGHTARVTAVAFSFDGKSVASTGHDGEVILWDTERRQARLRFNYPGQEQAAYCVAFSPDGRWVATTHGVYESEGGRQVVDFKTYPLIQRAVITASAFSPDGRRLACVASNYGDISLLDTDGWRLLDRVYSLPLQFTSATFSPDGLRVVTGENEHGVRLWQVEPLREEALLGRHAARVKSVAFSPDGRRVVSAGDDNMIALWDVAGRKLIANIGLHTAPVYAVAFSPDGKQLISGEHDHSVRLYTRRHTLWGFQLD